MSKRDKKGLRLYGTAQRKKDSLWPLWRAVSASLSAAALGLATAELCGQEAVWPLLLPTLLPLLHALMCRWGKEGWFYPGLFLLLLGLLFVRSDVIEGAKLCWNGLSLHYTAHTGRVLPLLETTGNGSAQLFLLLAGLLLAVGVLLLVTAAPLLLALLPMLCCALLSLWLHSRPSVGAVLLLLTAALSCLLSSDWKAERNAAALTVSALLCVLVGAIVLSFSTLPGVSAAVRARSEELHENAHQRRYENGYTTLPEGNFHGYKSAARQEVDALRVTVSEPESMYLRGFTATDFDGERWTGTDTALLAKNRDLLYWLRLNAFDPSAQFAAAAVESAVPTLRIRVENIGACSLYRYVPFGITDGGEREDLSDGVLDRTAARSYTFTALSSGSEAVSLVLESLQRSDSAAVLQYRKAESAYRSYVYSHYLHVSPEIEELLLEGWEEAAAFYGESLSPADKQACALRYLSAAFPEEGECEWELPLAEASGSWQQATVTVLTLRHFGIPARYAEGYYIPEELAAAAKADEPMEVGSSYACAWAEVYQDGIGWLPLAMTPGMGEMTEEVESDGQTTKRPPEAEEEEKDEPESESDGGTMVRVAKALAWGLLLALIPLLLLFLLLWLRRRRILEKRAAAYRGENRSTAVAHIFADTAEMLARLGLDRGNGSMTALCAPAEERFGSDYADRLRCMIDLNAMALFSRHEPEESDREAMIAFRDETLQILMAASRRYKRLWYKWILCLC